MQIHPFVYLRCVLKIDRIGTDKGTIPLPDEVRAVVSITTNKNWVSEIVISWRPLFGESIVPGTNWRLNVCKNRQAKSRRTMYSNWSVVGNTFHTPLNLVE